jgi:hypothetical protein
MGPRRGIGVLNRPQVDAVTPILASLSADARIVCTIEDEPTLLAILDVDEKTLRALRDDIHGRAAPTDLRGKVDP